MNSSIGKENQVLCDEILGDVSGGVKFWFCGQFIDTENLVDIPIKQLWCKYPVIEEGHSFLNVVWGSKTGTPVFCALTPDSINTGNAKIDWVTYPGYHEIEDDQVFGTVAGKVTPAVMNYCYWTESLKHLINSSLRDPDMSASKQCGSIMTDLSTLFNPRCVVNLDGSPFVNLDKLIQKFRSTIDCN